MVTQFLLALLLSSGVRGGVIKPPTDPEPALVRSVEPLYPPEAARNEEELDVVLWCTADRSGAVIDAVAVRGGPPFSDAAIAAVRQWLYEPSPDKEYRRFSIVVRFRLPSKAIHRESFATLFAAVRSATDGKGRQDAFRELFDRGADVLDDLMKELEHGDDAARCAALPFLDRMGPSAVQASLLLLALARRSARKSSRPATGAPRSRW
jgi:TonB family protein